MSDEKYLRIFGLFTTCKNSTKNSSLKRSLTFPVTRRLSIKVKSFVMRKLIQRFVSTTALTIFRGMALGADELNFPRDGFKIGNGRRRAEPFEKVLERGLLRLSFPDGNEVEVGKALQNAFGLRVQDFDGELFHGYSVIRISGRSKGKKEAA